MNIQMLLPYFYPQYGGVENQARAMSALFSMQGHSVSVATLRFPGSPVDEILDGVLVNLFGDATKASGYGAIAWNLMDKRIDVIHQHLVYGAGVRSQLLLGAGMSSLKQIPWVVKITSTGKVHDLSRLIGGKRLLRRATSVIAMNTAIGAELLTIGVLPDQIVTIPNGVDAQRFRPCTSDERIHWRDRLNILNHACVVTYVGRLAGKKGLDTLLQAWKIVEQQAPHAMLQLVGDDHWDRIKNNDPYGSKLQQLIDESGVENILMPGALQHPEQALWASDIFVLPSRNEGIPNCLLEAMACGLPCVGSDIPGISDVVIRHQENGLIFEMDNHIQLGKYLLTLVNNPSIRTFYGMRARLTIQSKFDFSVVGQQYLQLYERLITKEAFNVSFA